MKIACVFLSHFGMKCELRRHPEARGKPSVIVDRMKARPLALDGTPEAGAIAGKTLEEISSRHRNLIILNPDTAFYWTTQGEIVRRIQTKFDRVESSALGIICVQLDGFELIYGEDNLAAILFGLIPAEFNPRIGIGPGKFPAYVAALQSGGGEATFAPEGAKAFLSPFSVSYLPIPLRQKQLLYKFGLRALGQVASLNPWELQSQFGSDGRRIWEFSNGIDRTPLIPERHEEWISRDIEFPFPTASLELVYPVLEELAKRAFRDPDLKGRFVQKAFIEGKLLHGETWKASFVFRRPVSDAENALPPLERLIENSEIPNLLTDLKLTLAEFTSEPRIQLQLPGFADQIEPLSEVAEQLKVRLRGKEPLVQLVSVEPYHCLPERHQVWSPSFEPVNPPVPLTVKTDRAQRPLTVLLKRKALRVMQVTNVWKVIDYWSMQQPAHRRYYELLLQGGGQETVFMDMDTEEWFRQAYF